MPAKTSLKFPGTRCKAGKYEIIERYFCWHISAERNHKIEQLIGTEEIKFKKTVKKPFGKTLDYGFIMSGIIVSTLMVTLKLIFCVEV